MRQDIADSRKDAARAGVGPFAAGAVVVGNMVGVGVFTSLGFQVLGLSTGFPLLLLWMLGGVYALSGALCYAELTAALPRSGGEYHLLGRVYHPAVGFMSGWLSMTVGFAAPAALAAMAFGNYLHGVSGKLDPTLTSVGVVLLVTLVHLWRVRVSAGFQSVMTTAKVALLLVLIIAAFSLPSAQPVSFFPVAGDWAQIRTPAFAVSLIFVTYAYSGWNAAAYIVGEIRQPQRNLPRALVGGTLVVTLLYVLVNAGFLRSTPMDAMAGKPEVALVAARSIFGEEGGNLMGLLIAFGLISTMSAMTWAGPRVAMVAGQDFRGLAILGKTTSAGIPIVAILVQAAITLVLLLTGSFAGVLVYIEVAFLVSLSLTVFGVAWLRWREPELPRPFRLPCYPAVIILFVGMNGYIGYHVQGQHRWESLLGIGTLALGLGIYFLLKRTGGSRNSSLD